MTKKRKGGHLLYRVIATHLAVAIPPALVLGLTIVDTNRDALLLEAQNLHVSVAARLRDAIESELKRRSAGLEDAERILNADEIPLEERKTLLRSLVASGRLEEIGLYRSDGSLDSRISGRTQRLPEKVDAQAMAQLERQPFAIQREVDPTRLLLMMPWRRDGQVFGLLVTAVDLTSLNELALRLRDQYLGKRGQVVVVDRKLEVISATSELSKDRRQTPFGGFAVAEDGALFSSLETGTSAVYQAPDGKRLGSVVSSAQLQWLVGTSRPEEVALASIHQVRRRVLLSALFAALLAGLVGLALARNITQPLRRLIAALRQTALSGFRDRIDTGAAAEIGQLEEVFNYTLDELERHRAELRHRTRVRLRMARFLPPTALHQLLTTEFHVASSGHQEQVSLLYVDVVGASEGDDLEKDKLVGLLGELFVVTCAAVEEYGGRVDHFSGDAVIGIFAHEGVADPVSASISAAELSITRGREVVERHKEQLGGRAIAVSAGIATGSAVIGRAGASDEISVVGDIVDRAAALQQGARAATVRMDGATAAACREETEAPRVVDLAPETTGELVAEIDLTT